jgi:hypothetical protein
MFDRLYLNCFRQSLGQALVIGSALLPAYIRAELNKGINYYGVPMKQLYLYAKRLVPVLTVILLIVQIPDAGLSLWEHWQVSDLPTWTTGEVPLPNVRL